jgi:hypothetical protein
MTTRPKALKIPIIVAKSINYIQYPYENSPSQQSMTANKQLAYHYQYLLLSTIGYGQDKRDPAYVFDYDSKNEFIQESGYGDFLKLFDCHGITR